MGVIDFDRRYKDELFKMYDVAHKINSRDDGSGHIHTALDSLSRSGIKLLKVNNLIKGYIIYSRCNNSLARNTVTIDDLYVDRKYDKWENYMTLLQSTRKCSLFRHYDYAQINLDDKNRRGRLIVSMLDMSPKRVLKEMKIDLRRVADFEKPEGVEFKPFKIGVDESLRASIQNSIFCNSKWHVDCTIDDILYEEEQDYFLDDGGIFIYLNGNVSGYSQVILEKGNREKPCIVNFGICREYRGIGLSKLLLNYTLYTIKQKGYDEAYIDVDADNFKAYRLYRNSGFSKVGSQNSYLYRFK